MTTVPLLEISGICKQFPGVRALQDVHLIVQPDASSPRGEVVAVIGENGAGKSTLMKILAGVQAPDAGEIRLDGRVVTLDSVRKSLSLGIALIHQELNLADNLSVGANIFLGREPRRCGMIDARRIHQDAARVLERVGLDVPSKTPLHRLSIGKQQLVEIAKAISVDARVLIMDEPTSSLSSHETEQLFLVVNDLREQGVSLIYISHRLGEVRELADRVVVLRDGENAGTLDREDITHDNMVRLMVGRDVAQFYAREQHAIGEPLLEVRDLVTPAWPKHRLNFNVRRGEIVGVAGLVGAGRTEMLQTLFGIDKPLAGSVHIDGQPLKLTSPIDAIAAGIALVPEDRKLHGLVLDMNVRRNVSLAGLRRTRRHLGFLDDKREKADAQRMIQDLRIKTPSDLQITRFLSGGNQQKVVIGKWLALNPRLLLLDEPTRGIDVGAKQEIYRLMEKLARDGLAILFVSSEMEEVIGMSDRTIVMHEGRITGELMRSELTEQAVMRLATASSNSLPSDGQTKEATKT